MTNSGNPEQKRDIPPPVVAIGASAGGIEAFSAIPGDLGLAYLVIVTGAGTV